MGAFDKVQLQDWEIRPQTYYPLRHTAPEVLSLLF